MEYVRRFSIFDMKVCLKVTFLTFHLVAFHVPGLVYGLGGRVCNSENSSDYCCPPFFNMNEICIECPIGTVSTDGVVCSPCDESWYGERCARQCQCETNQICNRIEGCITENGSTTAYIIEHTEKRNVEKENPLILILSLAIAASSFVIVLVIVIIRCATRLGVNIDTILLCKQKDEIPDRRTNIYGSYQSNSLRSDEVEYEFESDVEEEGQYAVIRESRIMSTLIHVEADDASENCESLDQRAMQYDTNGYNHLSLMGRSESTANSVGSRSTNNMGTPRSTANRQDFSNAFSKVNCELAKKLVMFKNDSE